MKLQRLIAILTVLLQRDRVSATWFAEKFGVSVRTVYRDVAALESAGIPIVTHPGAGGGISILDTYKIDKKLFTHQDIVTLLSGLRSVSGALGGFSEAKINQTLEKVIGLIPEEHSRRIELSSKQLYVDMTPWAENPVITAHITEIQNALADSRLIALLYEGSSDSAPLRREVEPHQLLLKERNWYLRAYCRKREAFRTFKISRIHALELLDEHFTPREFEPHTADIKDWQSDRLIIVELLMDAELQEKALEYLRPDCFQDLGNGKVHVNMPFVECEMGYGVLLSMGHSCEVLAPAFVREELKRHIALLAAVYAAR